MIDDKHRPFLEVTKKYLDRVTYFTNMASFNNNHFTRLEREKHS